MVAVKSAIESLYKGLCDVYEFGPIKDTVTKITRQGETKTISAQPCRLSFKASPAASQSEAAADIKQTIKLFIDPSLIIKPGSKIVLTQNGRVTTYKSSGVPAVYTNHQEIDLELFDERA